MGREWVLVKNPALSSRSKGGHNTKGVETEAKGGKEELGGGSVLCVGVGRTLVCRLDERYSVLKPTQKREGVC